MRESHCFDTNIKHISDLTGTRNRISYRRSSFEKTSSTDGAHSGDDFTIEFDKDRESDCSLIVDDCDSSPDSEVDHNFYKKENLV